MVAERLVAIPKSTLIRLWHHSTLHLFKYVVFERL